MKIIICVLVALYCASVDPAHAQQSSRVTRIVVARPERADNPPVQMLMEGLRQGLRERGYVETHNIAIEILWLGGKTNGISERLTDPTRPKVDFIVTGGTSSTRAAQQATSTIPIIMASVSTDPVAEGFIADFARPGRNITGLTNMSTELAGKRLELVKEAAPKSSRVTVLLDPTRPRTADVREIEEAGHGFGVQIKPLVVESVSQFEEASRWASTSRADALMIVSGAVFNAHRPRFIELATKSRLPAMYTEQEYLR
jgi:putative tryptophan/tyrosine transport system substrate-binding protein